jgi:hypothetical protein
MYRKAYRKLFDELPGDIPASEARPSTPKAKGGRAGTGASAAKKRKAAAAEDATVDSPTTGEPATPGDASAAGFDGEARTPTITPAKRQRKSPVKKTAVYVFAFFPVSLSLCVCMCVRVSSANIGFSNQRIRPFQGGAGFRRPERRDQD